MSSTGWMGGRPNKDGKVIAPILHPEAVVFIQRKSRGIEHPLGIKRRVYSNEYQSRSGGSER